MLTEPAQKSQLLRNIVIFVTVLFTVFEVLVAVGVIDITGTQVLPPNLQTMDNWYDNPVIWVIGITILVNFCGFVENVVILKQDYDYNKFVETLYKYMPMIVVASQFLPNNQSALLAFVIDEFRRAFKKTS